MINLRLLARPAVAWELTANFARTSTYFAMLFVLAQYLQQGLGRSATYSGPGGPAGLRVRRGRGGARGERVRGRGLLVPVRPPPRRRDPGHA